MTPVEHHVLVHMTKAVDGRQYREVRQVGVFRLADLNGPEPPLSWSETIVISRVTKHIRHVPRQNVLQNVVGSPKAVTVIHIVPLFKEQHG